MNIKNYDNMDRYMTQQEIELLCKLYLNGELDIQEERELSKVLTYSNYSGNIVEECIILMGISRTTTGMVFNEDESCIQSSATNQRMNLGKLFRSILKSCAAVACLITVISGIWNYFVPSEVGKETIYEVYVDGKKLDPEISKKMALESYHQNMKLIAEMREMESQMLLQTERSKLEAERTLSTIESDLRKIN